VGVEQEVFGFGASAAPGFDLHAHRGQVIEIELRGAGRRVSTLVVGPDSPAAREGHDFYFITCTATCLHALKAALQTELGPRRPAASDGGP
jgi:hypothetical protein